MLKIKSISPNIFHLFPNKKALIESFFTIKLPKILVIKGFFYCFLEQIFLRKNLIIFGGLAQYIRITPPYSFHKQFYLLTISITIPKSTQRRILLSVAIFDNVLVKFL